MIATWQEKIFKLLHIHGTFRLVLILLCWYVASFVMNWLCLRMSKNSLIFCNNHETVRQNPAHPCQSRLSAFVVLRARKRRVFLARRRHVRAVANPRRHAANAGAAGGCAVAGCVFRRRFGVQAARFDVLVSRCRQCADAGGVRRQPVCQTNRH